MNIKTILKNIIEWFKPVEPIKTRIYSIKNWVRGEDGVFRKDGSEIIKFGNKWLLSTKGFEGYKFNTLHEAIGYADAYFGQ